MKVHFLLILCLGRLQILPKVVALSGDDKHTESHPKLGTFDHLAKAQDPLQMGAMNPANDRPSTRHLIEKASLDKRMRRDQGKWNISHPRYRLLEALFSFMRYRERNMAELERWRSLYKNVSKKQNKILESVIQYTKKMDDVEEAIYNNEALCRSIVAVAMEYYGIEQKELDSHMKEADKNKRVADKVSVLQTLKHFVRDWANEGSHERNEPFACIRSMLFGLESVQFGRTGQIRVLLPGAGLGRLGHEIAKFEGFEVTINEWSMYMNAAYRFLEQQIDVDSIGLFPFVDSQSHHLTTENMLRKVRAPDGKLHPGVLLVEGDFNKAFAGQAGHYDVIITHFFIDTARNLLSYFETIQRLLKHGGHWINFGPLLYGSVPYVQLSLEEIVTVVEAMGFEFEEITETCGHVSLDARKVRWMEAEYSFNGKALQKNTYKAQAWVARRP